MHLVKSKAYSNIDDKLTSSLYILQLRQTGEIINADSVKVGGYYLYKETFGMVCLVKVIENTSANEWVGFRLMVKRVLYSTWHVPNGYVFETGYCTETFKSPRSWHFEPGMLLLKTNRQYSGTTNAEFEIESVL